MCLLKEPELKSDRVVKTDLFHMCVSFPFMTENVTALHLSLFM